MYIPFAHGVPPPPPVFTGGKSGSRYHTHQETGEKTGVVLCGGWAVGASVASHRRQGRESGAQQEKTKALETSHSKRRRII